MTPDISCRIIIQIGLQIPRWRTKWRPCKGMAVSQAFIFHFKWFSLLYFAVCQFLCWAFLLIIDTDRITPANIAVIAGANCTFTCRAAAAIVWNRRTPGTGNSITIYNGYSIAPKYASRYKILRDAHGHCNLSIVSSLPSDAGRFFCAETGSSKQAEAELIVLGK